MKHKRKLRSTIAAILAFSVLLFSSAATYANGPSKPEASTPIKHLVVIFQENISFDHYFGTYPNALNPMTLMVGMITRWVRL
jgi:phospholipase C